MTIEFCNSKIYSNFSKKTYILRCYLNDKQKRLLTDLVLLRALLKISEGMDVVTLLTKLNIIRNDKEVELFRLVGMEK